MSTYNATYTGAGSGYATWSTSGGYESSYVNRRIVRPKEEWAGISLGRSYDTDTPWPYRREAQLKLFKQVKSVQRAVRTLVQGVVQVEEEATRDNFAVKPQLAAFYTGYPNPAMAAVAHTGFLELKSLLSAMSKELSRRCLPRAAAYHKECARDVLQSLLAHTLKVLANRAVLEEASRLPGLECIEHYRLFQASQCTLRFKLLHEIIEAIVLYGDVLPRPDSLVLNPITAHIFRLLAPKCARYHELLVLTEPTEFLELFSDWGNTIIDTLAPLLPRKRAQEEGEGRSRRMPSARSLMAGDVIPEIEDFQYANPEERADDQHGEIPPLDAPQPPSLAMESLSPEAMAQHMLRRLLSREEEEEEASGGNGEDDSSLNGLGHDTELKEAVNELEALATTASGASSEYEDPREDLLEEQLALDGYTKGPVEGMPTEGHAVEFTLDGEEAGGQLKDRPVDRCDNLETVAQLRLETAPITEALRRNLYPSRVDQPQVEHLHTSGQLDPNRLAIGSFCDAVYRRYRIRKEPVPRGKAVLLIAADGSSSLSNPQMRMCKLLTAAWLESAHRANVQILAALYNSEANMSMGNYPLVQWMYHPRKSPIANAAEAVSAVANLPDSGVGAQSDALSLRYMLEEAVKLSKGCPVYLTLISDCAWNKSLHLKNKTGEDEVAGVLEGFKETLGQRFHTTLVALAKREHPRIRSVVNREIVVEPEELSSPSSVAQKINEYVAACIRERRFTN